MKYRSIHQQELNARDLEYSGFTDFIHVYTRIILELSKTLHTVILCKNISKKKICARFSFALYFYCVYTLFTSISPRIQYIRISIIVINNWVPPFPLSRVCRPLFTAKNRRLCAPLYAFYKYKFTENALAVSRVSNNITSIVKC